MSNYEVLVPGGGVPGEHRAGALAARRLRVALLEWGLVGAECPYWACIPSKSDMRPRPNDEGADGNSVGVKKDRWCIHIQVSPTPR
jgi:dihydrolipoamide dehydrogenase